MSTERPKQASHLSTEKTDTVALSRDRAHRATSSAEETDTHPPNVTHDTGRGHLTLPRLGPELGPRRGGGLAGREGDADHQVTGEIILVPPGVRA